MSFGVRSATLSAPFFEDSSFLAASPHIQGVPFKLVQVGITATTQQVADPAFEWWA